MMPTANRYALITGAAGGLGSAFAKECATRGLSLILADLPGTGLYNLSDGIREKYRVDTIVVEGDLSCTEDLQRLYETVRTRGVLLQVIINNAGIGGTASFDEKNGEHYFRQIAVNVTLPTMLTRLFLEDLQRDAQKCYILNVASLAAYFSLAGKPVYGATKSYLLAFSKNLEPELRAFGIQLSVLCPGGIDTTEEMIRKHQRCGWFSRQSVMQPGEVAFIALRDMFAGRRVIVPGRFNRVLLTIGRLIPDGIQYRLSRREMEKLKA